MLKKFNQTIGPCIIRTRALQLPDLKYARLLKPFEDSGLVYDLPQNSACELALIYDLTMSRNTNETGYSNFLADPHQKMIPSDLYQDLHERKTTIPTLLIAYHTGSLHFRNFLAVRDYHQLQSLLGTLHSRGRIRDTRNLL